LEDLDNSTKQGSARSYVQSALKEFRAAMSSTLTTLQDVMANLGADHFKNTPAEVSQYKNSGQVYPSAGALATTPSVQSSNSDASMSNHVSQQGSSAVDPCNPPRTTRSPQQHIDANCGCSTTVAGKICQHVQREWHNPHADNHANMANTFTTLLNPLEQSRHRYQDWSGQTPAQE
jgi:hypothetical protein